MSTVHIVFGNESHRTTYARAKAVNPRLVVVATRPDLIQALMTEDVKTIKVVRFPEEVWVPTTHPCQKRATETEGIIKGYQRLGVTVMEEIK